MKQTRNTKQTKRCRIISALAAFALTGGIFLTVNRIQELSAAPVVQVVTEIRDTGTGELIYRYYTVYSNGRVKQTDTFATDETDRFEISSEDLFAPANLRWRWSEGVKEDLESTEAQIRAGKLRFPAETIMAVKEAAKEQLRNRDRLCGLDLIQDGEDFL